MSSETAFLLALLLIGSQSASDVDARDAEGRTALMMAVLEDDEVRVKSLLARGANPNLQDSRGDTALLFASERRPAIVRALVEAGADVNLANEEGRTPLIAAAQSHVDSVRILLERGASVSHRDGLGLTALTVAQAAGADEIVRLLLEAGARETLEARLHRAIREGNEIEVARLIAQGADVDALDTELYRTPMMTAIVHRRLEILIRLLEAGADPTREATGIETFGDNAIIVAAREGSPWALRALIDARSRPEDVEAALFAGCANSAVVRVALEEGAPLNARRRGGDTPLMCAAAAGSGDAVTLLLQSGADPWARAEDGTTALDRARALGHEEVAALLARAESLQTGR